MIIYRGLGNILFNKINPLHRNADLSDLTYGSGTSYSSTKELASYYGSEEPDNVFGWILTYEFTPKKLLTLTDANFDDKSEIHETLLDIHSKLLPLSELSAFMIKNQYDAAWFNSDHCGDHVFLTSLCDEAQLSLIEIELHTNDLSLINKLKNIKLTHNGSSFKIKLNQVKEVDAILNEYL